MELPPKENFLPETPDLHDTCVSAQEEELEEVVTIEEAADEPLEEEGELEGDLEEVEAEPPPQLIQEERLRNEEVIVQQPKFTSR